MSRMDPEAASFTPAPKPFKVLKSARYYGSDTDFENIKALFESLRWHYTVKTIYVTNGWHRALEDGRWRTYCGYCCNSESAPKDHYYLN